jgi:hypothetical protein
MIPITVPKLTSYICIISNPIVFEMTKQHELRTKGKIDLIDATHYIIISCLLLNVTAAVAQTLSLDAIF